MRQKVYQLLIELTNGKTTSKMLQSVTTSKWSRRLVPSYIRTYGINTKEVSKPIDSFESLHDFFIRQLNHQYRPIDQDKESIVSPVDAKVESMGEITDQGNFTVKGKLYTVAELLGFKEYAAMYEGGNYVVFYLSPADYHRIHSPVDGHLKKQYVLGAKSYPVNQTGLTLGKSPISGNYRQVSHVVCANQKKCAVVKVGAMFVNSIQLTNTSREWIKGEEVGFFTFGSTVVLLFEKDAISFESDLQPNHRIRMGEKIGSML
ncbi:MAG: phosphatidylserine decarboxylase [Paenisporosarcina sp.]